MQARYVLLLAWCLLSLPLYAKGEGEEEALQRLQDIKEVLIDARNVKQFRYLILPELIPYITDGGDVLSAKSNFSLPEVAQEKENAVPDVAALSDPSRIELPKRIPFAISADVSSPEFPSQLLWNAQGFLWKEPVWFGSYEMQRVKNAQSDRMIRGSWKRVYPATLPEPPKIPQLFREEIEVSDPKSLNRYSWLTFRFFGREEEDYVMVFSPITNQSRQLTGSNRSDAFLPGLFSVDDLMGWSGKIEWVDPTFQGASTMLLPFIDEKKITFKQAAPCTHASLVSNQEASRVQFIPSMITWVPRKVWKIELSQREPFASYGRTVMYFDAELNLPSLRVVYDRAGKLSKVTILSAALHKDENETEVFPLALTILSATELLADQILFKELSQCKNFPEGSSLGDYDPRRLGQGAAPATIAPAPKAMTPTPQEVQPQSDIDATDEAPSVSR